MSVTEFVVDYSPTRGVRVPGLPSPVMASPSTEPTKTNQGEVPADPQQLLSDEASPPWYVVSALGAPEHAAEYDASFLIPLHHPDAEQRALGLGDVLGELEITARLMITGGEDKEEARMTRADRSLIRQCILDAARQCVAADRDVLTRDVRDALRERDGERDGLRNHRR